MSTETSPLFPRPDPAFAAALEWQLRAELRRAARTPAPRRWPRSITFAVVAAASALAGAACLGAAMQVQESRRSQVVIAGLVLRENAARQTVQVARKIQQASEAMLNAGAITPADIHRAAARAADADTALRLIQTDLAEVRASSRPVRRELSAPRLDGRDFVLERLRIEQERAEARAKADAAILGITRKRIDIGFATMAEAADADLAAQLSTQAVSDVAGRIALREQFTAGALTAEHTEKQDLLARAQSTYKSAQLKLSAAQKALDLLSKRRAAGDVSNLDLSEAQLTVANLEVDLEIAKAELAVLQAPQ